MDIGFKPKAEILPTHTPALFDAAVARAAELLRAGELVALPTETVYGLAANALNARAVSRIFEAKGRPAQNPVIVHVASTEMARRCVTDWPTLADRLAEAWWPGPLTLVLPRSGKIPDIVHSGGHPGLWPSPRGAKREFVRPDFADERAACAGKSRGQNPFDTRWRTIANRH